MKHVLGLVAALVGGVALIGCAGRAVSTQPADSPATLPILAQAGDQQGYFTRPTRLVIRDQRSLLAARLGGLDVNFDEHMVLFVALGRMPDDRFNIRITEVIDAGPHLSIATDLFTPQSDDPPQDRLADSADGEDDPFAPGVIQPAFPWHAVVVPRVDKPVRGFATRVDTATRRGVNPFR